MNRKAPVIPITLKTNSCYTCAWVTWDTNNKSHCGVSGKLRPTLFERTNKGICGVGGFFYIAKEQVEFDA